MQSNTSLGLSLFQTLMLISRTLDSIIRRQQSDLLPPHFLFLGAVKQNPLPQREISRHLRIGASTVSATIDVLARRGLIARERSEADRRVILIRITPAGEELLSASIKNLLDEMQAILNSLTEDELETVTQSMGILHATFLQAAAINLPEHIIESPFPVFEEK